MNPTQLLTVASYYGAFAAPPEAPPTTPQVALIEAPADPNAPAGPRQTFDVTPMEQLQQARPADAEKLWAGPVDARAAPIPPPIPAPRSLPRRSQRPRGWISAPDVAFHPPAVDL